MKEKERLARQITSATEQLLNGQIAKEAAASALYLAMASWAEVKGYEKAAGFLYHHSDEERYHMLKLVRYVNGAGGHALQPSIKEVKPTYGSLKEVVKLALAHEVEVTASIDVLVKHCLDTQDYATFNFLQWYVTEQREEEHTARRAVELFDVIGEGGVGLYLIDKELGKLSKGAAASE